MLTSEQNTETKHRGLNLCALGSSSPNRRLRTSEEAATEASRTATVWEEEEEGAGRRKTDEVRIWSERSGTGISAEIFRKLAELLCAAGGAGRSAVVGDERWRIRRGRRGFRDRRDWGRPAIGRRWWRVAESVERGGGTLRKRGDGGVGDLAIWWKKGFVNSGDGKKVGHGLWGFGRKVLYINNIWCFGERDRQWNKKEVSGKEN